MKKSLLLSSLCLLPLLAGARAATTPHYNAVFSASVSKSVPSGPNAASLKVTHINNAAIFQALHSGSFSSVATSDMAIVINTTGGDFVDVIQKSTHNTLLALVTSGSDNTINAQVEYGHAASKVFILTAGSFQINLPDGTQFPVTSLGHISGVGVMFSPVLSISLSFLGGANDTVIQGNLRKQGKVYNY